jgi:hypothetical protein
MQNAILEAASQTFFFGTPVQLNAGGYVQAWDGVTIAAGILGIADSFGLNLTTNGAGFPTAAFAPVNGSIAIQTYGFVPNQALGVNTAIGTPVSEGRTNFVYANDDNYFLGMFDNSAGNVAADWTPTQATVNAQYGLTKDTFGMWYIDKNKTGASACVQVVQIYPQDGLIANARLIFKFLAASCQLNA